MENTSDLIDGIPANHFDFGYVDRCEDARELEKIYRNLKFVQNYYYLLMTFSIYL